MNLKKLRRIKDASVDPEVASYNKEMRRYKDYSDSQLRSYHSGDTAAASDSEIATQIMVNVLLHVGAYEEVFNVAGYKIPTSLDETFSQWVTDNDDTTPRYANDPYTDMVYRFVLDGLPTLGNGNPLKMYKSISAYSNACPAIYHIKYREAVDYLANDPLYKKGDIVVLGDDNIGSVIGKSSLGVTDELREEYDKVVGVDSLWKSVIVMENPEKGGVPSPRKFPELSPMTLKRIYLYHCFHSGATYLYDEIAGGIHRETGFGYFSVIPKNR